MRTALLLAAALLLCPAALRTHGGGAAIVPVAGALAAPPFPVFGMRAAGVRRGLERRGPNKKKPGARGNKRARPSKKKKDEVDRQPGIEEGSKRRGCRPGPMREVGRFLPNPLPKACTLKLLKEYCDALVAKGKSDPACVKAKPCVANTPDDVGSVRSAGRGRAGDGGDDDDEDGAEAGDEGHDSADDETTADGDER